VLIVLGATGHVGSAVTNALLAAGERVTVVTRDEAKADAWIARGAEAAVVDVGRADALRAVFRQGKRAFLLNPPASVLQYGCGGAPNHCGRRIRPRRFRLGKGRAPIDLWCSARRRDR
jgi:NAD(P)-dependent dehydrogenase (short-subunit alcohol dehydrogenase family)